MLTVACTNSYITLPYLNRKAERGTVRDCQVTGFLYKGAKDK